MRATTASRRFIQRRAYATWLSGERHRFEVPQHHHIYTDQGDYVIGCAITHCEVWRQPKVDIAVVELRDETVWLT
ncbi:hypothetical protein ACT3R7_11880 [Halomonas sp. AOP43-A1-21]